MTLCFLEVDFPVALCTIVLFSSQVSSCNYVARAQGVKAGMFMKRALELCPQLQIVPYQFEQYAQIMEQVFSIIRQYSSQMIVLSIDEAIVEVYPDPLQWLGIPASD